MFAKRNNDFKVLKTIPILFTLINHHPLPKGERMDLKAIKSR